MRLQRWFASGSPLVLGALAASAMWIQPVSGQTSASGGAQPGAEAPAQSGAAATAGAAEQGLPEAPASGALPGTDTAQPSVDGQVGGALQAGGNLDAGSAAEAPLGPGAQSGSLGQAPAQAPDTLRNPPRSGNQGRMSADRAAPGTQDFQPRTQGDTQTDTQIQAGSQFETRTDSRVATGGDSRPSLGVRLDEARDGLLVNEVIPGTPAATVGLAPGDRIVSVNGRTVESTRMFGSMLQTLPAGRPFDLVVIRGGREVLLQPVLVAETGFAGGAMVGQPAPAPLGMTLQDHVLIANVMPDSPAAAAGLQPGDILLAANGHPVHSTADFLAIAANAGPGELDLFVLRGGERIRVAADWQAPPAVVGAAAPGPVVLGMAFRQVEPGRILVTHVVPQSPAARAGIVVGDVLLGVGGAEIRTVDQLVTTIRQAQVGDNLAFRVLRDGREVNANTRIASRSDIVGESRSTELGQDVETRGAQRQAMRQEADTRLDGTNATQQDLRSGEGDTQIRSETDLRGGHRVGTGAPDAERAMPSETQTETERDASDPAPRSPDTGATGRTGSGLRAGQQPSAARSTESAAPSGASATDRDSSSRMRTEGQRATGDTTPAPQSSSRPGARSDTGDSSPSSSGGSSAATGRSENSSRPGSDAGRSTSGSSSPRSSDAPAAGASSPGNSPAPSGSASGSNAAPGNAANSSGAAQGNPNR